MKKTAITAILALTGLFNLVPTPFLCAANVPLGNVQAMAEREIARRQEMLATAEEQVEKADKAIGEKDYETAISILIAVLRDVSESEYSHDLRKDAIGLICKAYTRLAEQRILEGRYQDAENLCKEALKYDEGYGAAHSLLKHLADPEYYNKTITPGHVAKVEEVKKLLNEADGFFRTGRYDMAMKRYDQVLGLDPYNIAARKGQEKVNKARSDYAIEGYNETRSRMVWQVDNAWQSPVRKYGAPRSTIITQTEQDVANTAAITRKLNSIIIPRIDFRETSIREAVDFLKDKSRQIDPEGTGVNIVLQLDSSMGGGMPAPGGAPVGIPGLEPQPGEVPGAAPAPVVSPGDTRITLSLSQIPLYEALRYIASMAGLKIKIDPYAVAIVPATANVDVMLTKEYKVPPGFIQNVPSTGGTGEGGGFGAAPVGDATGAGRQLIGRSDARSFLESKGVQFPPGATAQHLPGSGKLIVRNTQSNLDLIDTLVDAALGEVPKQVEIEAKFVEITQTNLKELGFDWLLGQFNVPGSTSLFGGGGTRGNTPPTNNVDYPFVVPGGGPVGTFPVTGANRSGNLAIRQSAIDALLFGVQGSSQMAPGVFALAGVFTDPQFQLVIRALNQKKGVDLLSAPRVTTKAGQRAVIEIIREFRYPTEFEPPQIPQNFGSSGASGAGTSTIAVFPVTPTTPTEFETRNTGVTLEVEPQVGPDGYTIDLNLVPQVVEFEGFINYGSPIRTVNPAAIAAAAGVGGFIALPTGQDPSVVLTDNVINQPIFSTRKVTTSVSIWDGQTVVLGGLMREDIQKVEDKVPLLGDIPMVGRLFRSEVDQHLKRNLIIFVTARLMNPAGDPLLSPDEEEEVVEPLPLPEGLPPAASPEGPLFSK